MEARAVARYVRISPSKVKIVLDLIRGKTTKEALSILRFTRKAASPVIEKVLNSAVANAGQKPEININNLYIKRAFANSGPTMKRLHPMAMGKTGIVRHRSSHITIVVAEKQ